MYIRPCPKGIKYTSYFIKDCLRVSVLQGCNTLTKRILSRRFHCWKLPGPTRVTSHCSVALTLVPSPAYSIPLTVHLMPTTDSRAALGQQQPALLWFSLPLGEPQLFGWSDQARTPKIPTDGFQHADRRLKWLVSLMILDQVK